MAPTPVTSPRRFVVILAGLTAFLICALPAAAAKTGSCYVTPDPVPLGSDFTLTGIGLTPFGHYYVNITQAKDPSNGAHPQTWVQADANGVLTYVRNTQASAGNDALVAGRAKARIYPQSDFNDASGTASCWFGVSG